MKKFALLFRLNSTANAKSIADLSQKRLKWLSDLSSSGKLVDSGNSLLFSPDSSTVIQANKSSIAGPYKDSGTLVGGYMLIAASSLSEAVAIAESNPIFDIGGAIEVREVLERAPA